jgi:alpha-L-fucosidase
MHKSINGYQLAKALFLFFMITLFVHPVYSQSEETPEQNAKRMEWFKDAKLGIFIHWGIYSVKGIDESWSFYNNYTSYADYMKQMKGFTASKYNPDQWADLIQESGAKYSVLTTKHHDGVALWNTALSDLNVVKQTPAGRDLVGPWCDALRKRGIKVGLYFSLLDWSDSNYPNFTKTKVKYTNDSIKWNKFLKFDFGQLRELSSKYNPDLYWFDGDWEQSAEKWKAKELRQQLFSFNPNLILNSRLQGYGDYGTPEQGLPISRPKDKYWELCMTINESWGYQGTDHEFKSANQIIRIFTDCLNLGGNLLLDIGPKADGTIPDEEVSVLKELGRWTNKHQDAIYGTEAGIPLGHYYGATTLSKEKDILYLFLDGKPNGPLLIKGLKNQVNRIWVVGNGTKLNWKVMGKAYWSEVPGLLYIDVPEKVLDDQVTVIAVLLKGKVDLYGDAGQSITNN